jgi:hypothetical protein
MGKKLSVFDIGLMHEAKISKNRVYGSQEGFWFFNTRMKRKGSGSVIKTINFFILFFSLIFQYFDSIISEIIKRLTFFGTYNPKLKLISKYIFRTI